MNHLSTIPVKLEKIYKIFIDDKFPYKIKVSFQMYVYSKIV